MASLLGSTFGFSRLVVLRRAPGEPWGLKLRNLVDGETGVFVHCVNAGTPAAALEDDLQPGCRVVAVDGRRTDTFAECTALLAGPEATCVELQVRPPTSDPAPRVRGMRMVSAIAVGVVLVMTLASLMSSCRTGSGLFTSAFISSGAVMPSVHRVCIMILSHRRSKRRAWVRQIWAAPPHPPGVSLWFIVGRSSGGDDAEVGRALAEETRLYGDIIVVDAADRYRDLVSKVYAGLAAIGKLGGDGGAGTGGSIYPCDYVAKVDDDTVVNLSALRALVDQIVPGVGAGGKPVKFYGGIPLLAQPIIKDPGHPNHEPNYPHSEYDDYNSGGGYLLSGDVASYLASPPFPPAPMVNEDAAIGRMLAPYAVTPVKLINPRTSQPAVFPWGIGLTSTVRNGLCIAAEDAVIIHNVRELRCMEAIVANTSRGLPICDSFCTQIPGTNAYEEERRKKRAESAVKGGAPFLVPCASRLGSGGGTPVITQAAPEDRGGSSPLSPWAEGLSDVQVHGLQPFAMAGGARTEAECAAECCRRGDVCEVYQFCNVSSCGANEGRQDTFTCWLGMGGPPGNKVHAPGSGWIGRLRREKTAPRL